MHELSIAESIARVAGEHARGRGVHAVELKAGALRQVVPSALEFAFELVTQGTPLEGCKLQIEEVGAVGRCQACGIESPLPAFPLACPRCGALEPEVIRGQELLIDALVLEEDLMTTGGRG